MRLLSILLMVTARLSPKMCSTPKTVQNPLRADVNPYRFANSVRSYVKDNTTVVPISGPVSSNHSVMNGRSPLMLCGCNWNRYTG
jgi:hypothetical protein